MATRGRVSVSVAGAPAFVAKLRAAGEAGIRSAAAGLYAVGETTMTEAKRQVPVDLGALKGSGYVSLPEISGDSVTVELGFGGPAKDYAVIQHEELGYRHPDGGKAKFLEDPLNQIAPASGELMARVARASLTAGGPPVVATGPTTPWEGG